MQKKLENPDEIWLIDLKDDDMKVGLDYGKISLFYTYDRMQAQLRGQLAKAINKIAVGRAVQSCLHRELEKKFLDFEVDKTDYKIENGWDIMTQDGSKLDIKSFHIFSDYKSDRPELTREIILNGNVGDDWRLFFPMLIPQDQFKTATKDYYVFAFIISNMIKSCPEAGDKPRFLITIPHAKDNPEKDIIREFTRKKSATLRVQNNETFKLRIIGEIDLFKRTFAVGYSDITGKACSEEFELGSNEEYFISGLTGFHYLRLLGPCPVAKNERVCTITFYQNEKNIISWTAIGSNFSDAWLYNAKVLFIGWTDSESFMKATKQYPAWRPADDWKENAPWEDEETDRKGELTKVSFCYQYPVVFRGGTKNRNYYCLPKDLFTMDSIGVLFKSEDE